MENSKSNGNIKRRRPRRKRYTIHILNDDINSFQYVIETLKTTIPMCNYLQAEQMAMLIHEGGSCDVYSGFTPEVYIIYAQLQKSGLSVQIKQ